MAKTSRPTPPNPPRDPNSRATQSGPAGDTGRPDDRDRTAVRLEGTDALSARQPYNALKPSEFEGHTSAPRAGTPHEPPHPVVGASTVQETQASDKVGDGTPKPGVNRAVAPLDRVRADSTGRGLTTNQAVPIADNQNSLKAGLRGPTLMEDFILREKITHFDHERIPERVVHARGSGAHGYFECYEPLTALTRASLFSAAGKRTPVFVRFSTVIGERGSTDTARDVRGFATKFYTDEGNWDLVGNNIPVFFIQDAMKFPDLVHAAKPEPHHAMPQAATAHDTFWDFASLMPEITHMLMWAMSDRAIPRSYRMMHGFGVHTFRLVNADGASHLVKFHWIPAAGTHSLVWDEAVKISGADPDFHRRDLWEAIEAGHFPEYELGLQVFTEADAERFTFDILDATKIVPEELVPIRRVGRMVLDRNPDNFFAETEQVAFCTSHIVPGIDFTNDPLLQGRNHSYVDTQISRLGGPNFHEIPINAPVSEPHNNQRDGMHRQTINRGRVNYEPNSLAGGCPFQVGASGFASYREPMDDGAGKMRGKPERFAEHHAQARLFWNSQTAVEQQHIIAAFRFELARVQTPTVRRRMVAGLLNVDRVLAESVAKGLGLRELPDPLPMLVPPVEPEVTSSPSLSLMALPGHGGAVGRRVAILVADDVDGAFVEAAEASLRAAGAVARRVAPMLGEVVGGGGPLEVDTTVDAMPSVLWDGVVIPNGSELFIARLLADGRTREFISDQYRHCKPILAAGPTLRVLDAVGAPRVLPLGDIDPGIITGEADDATGQLEAFVAALGRHRAFEREVMPPRV